MLNLLGEEIAEVIVVSIRKLAQAIWSELSPASEAIAPPKIEDELVLSETALEAFRTNAEIRRSSIQRRG